MTEREYMNVVNLARIRVVIDVLRQMVCVDDYGKSVHRLLSVEAGKFEEKLASAVRIR